MEKAYSVTTSGTERLETGIVNNEERLFAAWLDTVVIGQPKGKRAVLTGFRRTMSRMRLGRKPRGAFIFLGPTSCGKSEIVYRFVEWLHGDRRCLLKIDGSEYQHDGELTKLKGATNMWAGRVNKNAVDYVPPSASEKDTTCELNPHNVYVYARHLSKTGRKITVILVDEWDKGCREFNDIWLSIMRDGVFTNGGSEEVDFSDTIIFFTGNNGSRAVEEEQEKRKNGGIGFNKNFNPVSQEEAEKLITEHLKAFAPPEFRSRINELGGVVFFDALTNEQVFNVCDVKVREAKDLATKLAGVELVIGDDVKRWLLKRFDNDLARVTGGLTTNVLDVLDNELIKGTVVADDSVSFTALAEDAKELDVTRAARKTSLVLVENAGDEAILAELARASGTLLPGSNLPLRTEDVDAATDKRLVPNRLRGSRVDSDKMRALAQQKPAGEGEADESSEAEKSVEPAGRVFQPFLITVVLENEAAVNALRTKLMALAPQYKFNKVHEEIDPVDVNTKTGSVKALMVKTHVIGLIEFMHALKVFWPQLNIKVEEIEMKTA